MRFLRTNTAVIITVGPFYDKTDGVTIETGLTITNERITLTADTDAGSAPTVILDNVTGATSATANDLNYITGNDAGLMQLELSAANVNRLGRMFLSITDAANHVPVFHEFMVLPAMIYDSFILGTDVLDASVTQWAGTAVASPHTAGYPAVTIKDGTGTGEINTNAGAVALVDLVTTTTTTTGVTTVNGLAANVITAASIAADAIGASELAADAVAEIQSGLATAAALTAVDDFLDTEIAAIITTLGVAGAGLTALATQASVNALNNLSQANVRSAVGLAAANLDAQLAAIDDFLDTEVAAILADTNELQTDWANGGRLDLILDAAGAAGTPPTVAQIADGVWDEAIAGHLGAGSTGLALNGAGSAGDPWTTALPGAYGAGSAGKIIGDNINATISSRASQTSVDTVDNFIDTEVAAITTTLGIAGAGLTAVPWNVAWDAEVQSECTDALNAYDPPTNTEMEARTIVAANYATALALDTVDNFLDTEVAAILTAVDTEVAGIKAVTDTLIALLATLQVTVDPLGAAFTVAGNLKADVLAIDGSLPAATALQRATRCNVLGTIGVGSSNVSLISSSLDPAAASVDQYKGRILTFTRDTTTAGLRGQATGIISNTAGGVFTVLSLSNTPVNGDSFAIT